MDQQAARLALRKAWMAGLVQASLALALGWIAIERDTTGALSVWDTSLLQVLILLPLTFGIWRRSRLAAVLMFLGTVLAQVALVVQTGKVTGLALGLVFAYLHARAVQGAYVLWTPRPRKPKPARTSLLPWWGYYVWPGLIALVGLFLLAALAGDDESPEPGSDHGQ